MAELVDGHLHVWDETAFDKSPGPMRIGYSPQGIASVELFQEYMSEAGVGKAVFTQGGVYRWDNSYMASCIERFPDKFRGTCIIDPRGKQAATQLKSLRARGVTGVRLRPPRDDEGSFSGHWLDAEETFPLWEVAAKEEMNISVLWAGAELSRLEEMLRRFPTVQVIVDQLNLKGSHPAGVDQPDFKALLGVAHLPQVHVKISGYHHWCSDRYPYSSALPMVEAAVHTFGAERCLWGSDFPHVLAACGYVRIRHYLDRHAKFLKPGECAQIMGGTAERLWFGTKL